MMKKIFILTLVTLLILTSCLFLQPQPEITPTSLPATSTPDQENDLSIFKSGLNPIYHAVIDELSTASVYTIDLVIEDNLYQISGKEIVDCPSVEYFLVNILKSSLSFSGQNLCLYCNKLILTPLL